MIVQIKNISVNLDREDIPRVLAYNWRLVGAGYIAHNIHSDGKQHSVYLHHFLIGQPLYRNVVDHINGNIHDNRKCNLRIVSSTVNNLNKSRLPSHNTSGHIGIQYRASSKRWLATIEHGYKRVFIGSYPTKIGAIRARQTYERSL